MHYLISVRKRKAIAIFMLAVFYFETILPAHAWAARAMGGYRKNFRQTYQPVLSPGAGADPSKFQFGSNFSRQGLQVADNPVAVTSPSRQDKALIGGPGQPEMSSFQSVNADNMVDLFTGDFSYNIPLLDVGGYPVNIHYSGGPTIDQEASWVGLGWNINPGAIGRTTRGLPDEFNGEDQIKRVQKIKDNKTVGVGVGAGLEVFGGVIGLNFNLGVFNNTYNGWGVETGVNANISAGKDTKGPLTASLGLNNNSQSGLNISPGIGVRLSEQAGAAQISGSIGTNYNTRTGISGLQFNVSASGKVDKKYLDHKGRGDYHTGSSSVYSSSISFATPAYVPSIQMPFTSTNFTFSGKYGGEIWGAHPNLGISGYVSRQYIADEDTLQSLPAYGYLHYTKGKNDGIALLDLNREKEIYFNAKSTPHIAIPQYTYDVFNISGEGTGGSFRAYRSEAGYVRDHHLQTKSESDNFAINVGAGAYVKAGVDYNETIATTRNSAWRSDITPNLDFAEADSVFQPVYFRNPGEKTSNTLAYYRSIGGDSTVRIKLDGAISDVRAANAMVLYSNKRAIKEIPVTAPLAKTQRDKRTQVITYRTAAEAKLPGLALEPKIYSYKENSIPVGACPDTTISDTLDRQDNIRKAHHISEITVLNADGRRYIYGLPAYNLEQQDVTFAIAKETDQAVIDKGLAGYTPESDNHANTNRKGKDNFFSRDITPPHAHSFLLTGLVSADYIDITGDGISDDDPGDAVKFHYSMIYGKDKGYYRWRTPNDQDKVNYSEGLKTYNRDDKGTYMYGQKEIWYLNSVSSKTMIAVFRISDKREDGLGIIDENGGIDQDQKLRRLERIDLYSKPDVIKNGSNARPVKSVHFEYDYSLCRNTLNNSGLPVDKNGSPVAEQSSSNVNKNKGKLTLRKIWFSYNGNYKGMKNPYIFNYGQVEEGQPEHKYNPEHNSKHYDRWGNYKSPDGNPSGLNNVDYPYVIQDSAVSAQHVNAWQLTDIRLPSGGLMKISYEADDYAYVQDRRAMQLFSIAGFAATVSGTPSRELYTSEGILKDNDYLFVDVNEPVSSKEDIYRKYLEGVDKIFCKIAVVMPSDIWGEGYEMVPTYLEIEGNNYGVVPGNNKRIWMKLAYVDGKHPVTLAALQFMKLNLPSKAYPTSEMGEDLSFENAVKMLVSSVGEIQNMVTGFYEMGRVRAWCKQAELSSSFIRLNSPLYKKYGGGYRVKRVEVFDNWKQMTNQREASYGQSYIYTTTKVIARNTITGGVSKIVTDTLEISSGVAAYEPFIGGEENPFREPMEYEERISVLAPKNYMYSERPLGESFFPGAMVGYSKVRVRTIHTKARSANGWQETEFFTTRDFPTIVDHTPLDGASKKIYNPTLKNLLKLNAVKNITIAQGFKVELNDMNGKMKSQANYAENNPDDAIHYTRNFYKVDDEKAPQQHLNNTVWVVDSLNGSIDTRGIIGLDIEIMNDMREQYSITNSKNHQVNLDLIPFIWFPLPVPSYFPMFQKEENTFRSAATVKIVQRYGILDSVVVVDKGSIVSTRNLVYDGETGEPVLSRTNNEFDDPVYQFSYPAHWAYSGMSGAYKNVDAVFKEKKIVNGKMSNKDNSPFDVERFFESGDEILIQEGILYAPSPDCPPGIRQPLRNIGNNEAFKIWAIDASKGKQGQQGIHFIDENGVPAELVADRMQIIRSGHRNMTGAAAGNIVSLGSPVKEVSPGVFRLVIDSNINVINTAATVYKDLWQVEKTYYVKDSVVQVYRDFDPLELRPAVTVMKYDVTGGGSVRGTGFYTNSSFLVAGLDFIHRAQGGAHCRPSRTIFTRSILEFNFGAIPVDAIVLNARLTLTPKVPRNFLPQVTENRDCPFTSNQNSYDWGAATNYYLGESSAWLKRINGSFNANTDYHTFPRTEINRKKVEKDSLYLDCTTLIGDIIASDPGSRHGLVFELNKTGNSNVDEREINYLSFCSKDESNVNSNIPGYYCDNHGHGGAPPCNCYSPILTVEYRALVDSTIKLCKENISDTATNPYRWGILGNWRAESAYTWYSDRRESDAADTTTNIRIEGALRSFMPYWAFSDSGLVNIADTTKWVWNAASATYNRRGFEVENYDPLGRYNAGLYGYNQSLPVAVAQNSRYRELLYDGFEDYGFKNAACDICPSPRDYDFTNGQPGVSIDNTVSHTGISSLKIASGGQSLLTAPVSGMDSILPAVSVQVDSFPIYSLPNVGGSDDTPGLNASYYTCAFSYQYDYGISFYWGYTPPAVIPGCNATSYNVTWTGKLQARYSDWYTIYLVHGGTAFLSVNGVTSGGMSSSGLDSVRVQLTAGQLYYIEVQYANDISNSSFIRLEWQSDENQVRGLIPGRFLYPYYVSSPPPSSITYDISGYCLKAGYVTADSIIRSGFRPLTDRQMVVSAWLKTDEEQCIGPPPANAISVAFRNGVTPVTSANLEPTGVRIENWQRYEKIITVPQNATEMELKFNAPPDKAIFIDDVRVQPFNSSMKSFAYDPVSLRLMAELDENNYASFYEYDNDGTLIRVKKETERGIKTIKETRSALRKEE